MDISDVDLRLEQSVDVVTERERLLALGGFRLIRCNRHAVWQSGRHVLVLSNSPSDHRTIRNELGLIRRTLRNMGVLS